MLAQLLINYGESSFTIPYAYIAYVVGSFVLLWGFIKTGKRGLRVWEQEIAIANALESRREAARLGRRKELVSSLPGIWITIYDALDIAGHGHLARHVIARMICTADKKINVKDNPLPPEGARHILSLVGGSDVDADAVSCWIDDYVVEWIRNKFKGIPQIDYDALGSLIMDQKAGGGVEQLRRIAAENSQIASIFPNLPTVYNPKAEFLQPRWDGPIDNALECRRLS